MNSRASKGVEASQKVGETYELPARLALLAKLRSDRGKFEEADRLYEQAEDVIDGLLVSVMSPTARTSLIGATSQIYVDHLTLTIDHLSWPAKAFEVLERARGRTAVDVLTSRERTPNVASRTQTAHEREIARLQIRLMRASTREERREILEKLFEEEQGLSATKLSSMPRQLGRGQPIDLRTLQQMLRPGELIVEYALAPPRSHCLLIDKNEIRAIALPDRDRIEALVDGYVAQVRSKKRAKEPARELYSVLLESRTKDVQARHLIVVPDGKLHLLPFDVSFAKNVSDCKPC
jgi:hypothetical protein